MHDLGGVTEHEDFAPVCLNRAVLRTAVVGMTDVRQESHSHAGHITMAVCLLKSTI